MELLNKYIPHFIEYFDEFLVSIKDTLFMMFVSGVFVVIIGLILGILLVVTQEGNILENKWVHHIIDKSMNILRSIPFIILLVLLLDLSKIIVGTKIGPVGAIIPLIFGAVPFFVRQVDAALSDMDKGIIEAAQSMGLSPFEIITKVYLRECIPGLVRAVTITLISLLGLTTLGGAVAAGGIGGFVLRYGHVQQYTDITWICIVVILIFVSVIQGLGNVLVKKAQH